MANPKFLLTIVITAMVVLMLIAPTSAEASNSIDESDHKLVNEPSDAVDDHDDSKQDAGDDYEPADASDSLLSVGLRRFLGSKWGRKRTCDRFPWICRARGSPGPYCCKKLCVNIQKDRVNCGGCGRKCRYNQSCCNGRCTKLSFDPNNCGRCGKKCGRFQRCLWGLCSYA